MIQVVRANGVLKLVEDWDPSPSWYVDGSGVWGGTHRPTLEQGKTMLGGCVVKAILKGSMWIFI
jgi:hypothetical protein